MYLENSEQTKVSAQGQLSTEAMPSEHCQLPEFTEVADLIQPSKEFAELSMKLLEEYSKQTVKHDMNDPAVCVEVCESGQDFSAETFTYFKAAFDQDSESEDFSESDETPDKCETLRLSQQSDECSHHCVCFNACESPDLCANHSLSICCEQCTGRLQSSQLCAPANPQSCHYEAEDLKVDIDNFGLCDTPDFTESDECCFSGSPCESFDSKPDALTEDSEQCEEAGITPNISDSMDLSDYCDELCDRISSGTGSVGDSFEEEESLSEGDLWHREDYESEETSEQQSELEMSKDDSRTHQEYEETYDIEEDSSSECSSFESKSFQTCPEGSSIPSEPCSESSDGSEKGALGDSFDEQTQWESFEDDEDNLIENAQFETQVVVEDYFSLFDRSDDFALTFAKSQRYISCFDGGDIHDRLYLEEIQAEAQNHAMNSHNDETNVLESDEYLATDEFEEQREDEAESESDLVEYEYEDNLHQSESSESENEGDGESVANVPAVVCFPSDEEIMFAPFADNISVEGDAYEDNITDFLSCDNMEENTDDYDDEEKEEEKPQKEPPHISYAEVFSACSENEPYWFLLDFNETRDFDVEEYYSCQIKSIQTSSDQTLRFFILEEEPAGEAAPEEEQNETTQLSEEEEDCSAGEQEEAILLSEEVDKASTAPLNIIHSVENTKTDQEQVKRTEEEEEEEDSDYESSDQCECEYCSPTSEQEPPEPLLPQMISNDTGKICVLIDLDETLVHSSFKPVNNADFIIPVEIDGTVHQVYVLKRPHVDEFLQRMGELFECVLFTASLSKYADPVSDELDKCGAFRSRLFREACVFHRGNYVKDLSRLGRDLNKVIIIDNSPASYIFHPDNAVPVVSWFDDTSDSELLDLIPFFERLSSVDDVYDTLKQQKTSGEHRTG